ncbi:MAG TPA: phosphodiester glycosidase family protein, partial [Halanaerobiales bacterium]|nr:phosphodiester glycosidase family protein [Halanaerobiales bacterium]
WWGPRNITVLDLDLNRENLIAEPVLAGKGVSGLADLAEMVKKQGALAGINGGYFGSNARPLGFLMKDGMVISEPLMERTSLIFTEGGEVIISPVKWQACLHNRRTDKNFLISGVNRKPGTDEAVIINRYYGERAPELKEGVLELVINTMQIIAINDGSAGGSTAIPAEGYIIQIHGKGREAALDYQPGDVVEYQDIFETELKDLKPHKALGAGPRLIENGEIKITAAEEEFQPDISYGRAPRTAAGLTAEGHLLMVTIDGRQPELSIGMTLNELAEWMINHGIIEGMNLDGGYSARMVVRGFTMNNPGQERLVNNGILIFSR